MRLMFKPLLEQAYDFVIEINRPYNCSFLSAEANGVRESQRPALLNVFRNTNFKLKIINIFTINISATAAFCSLKI